MMLVKFVQKVILFKKDFYERTLSKMEKKLVNIFQLKVNGVIRPAVSEQESLIFITLTQ
jgi:hypothetical protein